MIAKLLSRMDRWLVKNRPEYYGELQPGVTDQALNRFEKRFRLKLPKPFRELYAWRNGQKSDCFDSLQFNRQFSSLEEITEIKDMLDEMIETEFDDPKWWRIGWVPFLSNGGGDHLCLDLMAEDGGKPGQLIAFWHDEGIRSIEHPSLKDWLTGLVESMEDGTLEIV